MLLFQTTKSPSAHQEYVEHQPMNDDNVWPIIVMPQETDVPMLEPHTVHIPFIEAKVLDFTHENTEDSRQDTENKIRAEVYIMVQNCHTHLNTSSSQKLLSNDNIRSNKRTRGGQPVTSIASDEYLQLELHDVLDKYLSLKSDKSDSFLFSEHRAKFFKEDDYEDDDDSQSTASAQEYEGSEYSFSSSLSVEPEEFESSIEGIGLVQEDEKEIELSIKSFLCEDSGNDGTCYSESDTYEDPKQHNNTHHMS